MKKQMSRDEIDNHAAGDKPRPVRMRECRSCRIFGVGVEKTAGTLKMF